MSDLDVAVRPRDLDATVRILSDLGWRRMFADRARYAPRHGHDVALVNESGHVLEVHYQLFHELAVDASVEPLFARAIEVELLGQRGGAFRRGTTTSSSSRCTRRPMRSANRRRGSSIWRCSYRMPPSTRRMRRR